MTNGEKFKEVFGFGADGSRVIAVNATWWDCEFQNSKPVTSVPPHGRWNNINQGIIPSGQCSNCGAWDRVTRFCPNCGAMMEDRKE